MNPACPHRRTDNEHDTMGLVHVLTGRGGIRCQPKDGPLTPGDNIIPLYETEPVMTDDEQIYEDISEQVNDPEHSAQDLPAETYEQLELPFEEAAAAEGGTIVAPDGPPNPVRTFYATYTIGGAVSIQGASLIEAATALVQNNPGIDLHAIQEVATPVQESNAG